MTCKKKLSAYNNSWNPLPPLSLQFRNPRRFSPIEWVFLVVSSLSMLGVLVLNIERFVSFERDFYNLTTVDVSEGFHCSTWYCTSDVTFSLLLLINLCKCNLWLLVLCILLDGTLLHSVAVVFIENPRRGWG